MKIPRDALIRPITFSMIPAFFHCSSLDSTIALISKNWYHTVQEIKMSKWYTEMKSEAKDLLVQEQAD